MQSAVILWKFTRGEPKKTGIYLWKKLCVYPYMFKLQPSSKYSPCAAIHLLRCFSTAPNSFLTRQSGCLLVLLSFFVLPLPRLQNICLWGLFSSRETRKCCWGWDWVNREDGHGGRVVFGQKLLHTQCSAGRCACESAIMKWANVLKESSKKFTEAKCSLSQQCQLVHWHRWVPRTLT